MMGTRSYRTGGKRAETGIHAQLLPSLVGLFGTEIYHFLTTMILRWYGLQNTNYHVASTYGAYSVQYILFTSPQFLLGATQSTSLVLLHSCHLLAYCKILNYV
jgi:hypothetical protein